MGTAPPTTPCSCCSDRSRTERKSLSVMWMPGCSGKDLGERASIHMHGDGERMVPCMGTGECMVPCMIGVGLWGTVQRGKACAGMHGGGDARSMRRDAHSQQDLGVDVWAG